MKQGTKTAAKRARKGPGVAKARTVLKVGSDFYVLASSLTSRRETRVLADAQSFAVFEVGGDIADSPVEALGFFFRDTRFLSGFEMSIAGQAPYFLNSYLSDDNAEFRVNLTNPDLTGTEGKIELPRNSIQIERSWVIVNAALYHRLIVSNYSHAPARLPFDLAFGVDFADLFEVRGVQRSRRGQDLHKYLRWLEQLLIDLLAKHDIAAQRRESLTGVWVENRKIASIGVGVRHWITMHGFALNVCGDLSPFNHIVPCGINNVAITSMEKEKEKSLTVAAVARAVEKLASNSILSLRVAPETHLINA